MDAKGRLRACRNLREVLTSRDRVDRVESIETGVDVARDRVDRVAHSTACASRDDKGTGGGRRRAWPWDETTRGGVGKGDGFDDGVDVDGRARDDGDEARGWGERDENHQRATIERWTLGAHPR